MVLLSHGIRNSTTRKFRFTFSSDISFSMRKRQENVRSVLSVFILCDFNRLEITMASFRNELF